MDKAIDAMQHIPSEDRETWIHVGMALRDEYGDDAFQAWDNWSQGADNYNAAAAVASWRSFRGSGVTIASLYKLAIENGWVPGREYIETPRRERVKISDDREPERKAAAEKAKWILSQCKQEKHAYLDRKGFRDEIGPVFYAGDRNLLCIPMYHNGLCGLQMIDINGNKKFLIGQRAQGASFTWDSGGGVDIWCEGFATGLSVRTVMRALKMPHRIHVCFSAANLKHLAHTGFVVADNDESEVGEKVAKSTGLKYWISDTLGEDFNDYHRRKRTFAASQSIKRALHGK